MLGEEAQHEVLADAAQQALPCAAFQLRLERIGVAHLQPLKDRVAQRGSTASSREAKAELQDVFVHSAKRLLANGSVGSIARTVDRRHCFSLPPCSWQC